LQDKLKCVWKGQSLVNVSRVYPCLTQERAVSQFYCVRVLALRMCVIFIYLFIYRFLTTLLNSSRHITSKLGW